MFADYVGEEDGDDVDFTPQVGVHPFVHVDINFVLTFCVDLGRSFFFTLRTRRLTITANGS